MGYKLRGGRIAGQDHSRAGKNCQDGFCFKQIEIAGKKYWVGSISDGCGQSSNSEIAATLSPVFVVGKIISLLTSQFKLEDIPYALYLSLVEYLKGIIRLMPSLTACETVDFVQNYLLSTVLGFIVSEEKGIVFEAGDGFIVINEEVIEVSYDNRSPYPAYHLVSDSLAGDTKTKLPWTFKVIKFEKPIEKLAIASDGFNKALLDRMWKEANPVPLGIQLWMNFINGPRNNRRNEGFFFDDATIVALQRAEGGV